MICDAYYETQNTKSTKTGLFKGVNFNITLSPKEGQLLLNSFSNDL